MPASPSLEGAASAAPARDAVDVILRDGGTLRLEPPAADDTGALVSFFAALSERSLYQRFHGYRQVDLDVVAPLAEPDWTTRGALVGRLGKDDESRIVAVGSYVRIGCTDAADMAFAVADAEQERGIGTRLLEQLAARAREHGMRRFVADVLSSNTVARRVFADAGFDVMRDQSDGDLELRFPILATSALEARVEQRDHIAVVASLRPFFEPRTVAVIGASPRRGSIGGELFRNIVAAGFSGAAYPVNLKGESVAAVRAYRSVAEIPDAVDLAVICVPAEYVIEAAETALGAGVPALCVVSAGFAEMGTEGRERQDRLLALVRAHGGRLVGPNCLGVAVPGLGLNATFAPRALPPGGIGFSSQSGALGLALLEKAAEHGLGFSSFVSIGNKADVSTNDLLEWWEEDESTRLLLMYAESFGNPRAFARIARRVARRKPILALKAGATSAGSRAAGSHTAALAGSDAAADALFRQTGVLRAGTLEELIDAATLLSSQPLPAGRRVGVITNAGGLGILCADACETFGLELPELSDETRAALAPLVAAEASLANPIDLLGSATAGAYEAVIGKVLNDGNVDALVVLFVPPVVAGSEEVAWAIRRSVEQAAAGKPVVAVVVSAEGIPAALRGPESPVAALSYPESAARALAFAVRRAEWLATPPGEHVVPASIDRDRAHLAVAGALARDTDVWLEASEIREVFAAYGIPTVGERVAATGDEAVAAAGELGYPVVVKTAAAGVHKTDVGGVALDLRDETAVRAAVERIGTPVLVQEFLTGGIELLAGAVQDPMFGPLVAFGPGGAMAELIGDASFRLAPLTDRDAHDLVATGKAGKLVAGFRGAPAADAAALEDLLLRLGRLAEDLPEVAELDLNPVLAWPDRCVAVDARVRVATRQPQRRVKGW